MSTRSAIPAPVHDDYLADPFVWRHGDTYYAIGTGKAEADGTTAQQERVIPMLTSRDLVHWRYLHHVLVPPQPSLGGQFWAPEVAFADGRFFLYYSTGNSFEDRPHQLRVATADRPEGPYEDVGEPLLLPGEETFVFDPHPVRDDDGHWYLFYCRNFWDTESGARPGDAIVARPLETMTRLGDPAVTILRPDADWQRGPIRQHQGQDVDWHTTEGACVVKRDGLYYCFYSGSAWFTETYGVHFVVAGSVLGPYRHTVDDPAPGILRATPGALRGPGHNSIVTGPDGEQRLVYHAWNAEMTKRQMHIDRLRWIRNPQAGPAWLPTAVAGA